MFQRQCTNDWKIAPMRRWLQKERMKKKIDMLIGISLDEIQRMRNSDVQYISNKYPLIEKRMTRNDCQKYLERNSIPIPPRSACVFCPFQTNSEWRTVMENPDDAIKAIRVDEDIRRARPPRNLYVCVQRKPLYRCGFETPEDKGQLPLWENECLGMCGV
jgi:hypothetical protein